MAELPGHLEAVRAAVLDDLPDRPLVGQGDLSRLKDGLQQRLIPVIQPLREGVEVHVDRYVLGAALRCPASADRGEFRWTGPRAARSLGLPAVSALHRRSTKDVLGAVRRSVAEAADDDRSLGSWLSTLDDAGRAITEAAAVTWCSRAWLAVPWDDLGKLRFGLSAIWHRPFGRDTALVLRGRPDAIVRVRGGRGEERVLLNVGWFDPIVARLDALVAALDNRRSPLRIVTVHAASGTVTSVPVDLDVLEHAAEDVVAAATVLAPIANGAVAPETAGAHCWWCDRRGQCPTGIEWMARQPRRVAGIPVAGVTVSGRRHHDGDAFGTADLCNDRPDGGAPGADDGVGGAGVPFPAAVGGGGQDDLSPSR